MGYVSILIILDNIFIFFKIIIFIDLFSFYTILVILSVHNYSKLFIETIVSLFIHLDLYINSILDDVLSKQKISSTF